MFADAKSATHRQLLPIYTQLTHMISCSIPYQSKIVTHIQDTESEQLKKILQVLRHITDNTSLEVSLS